MGRREMDAGKMHLWGKKRGKKTFKMVTEINRAY